MTQPHNLATYTECILSFATANRLVWQLAQLNGVMEGRAAVGIIKQLEQLIEVLQPVNADVTVTVIKNLIADLSRQNNRMVALLLANRLSDIQSVLVEELRSITHE